MKLKITCVENKKIGPALLWDEVREIHDRYHERKSCTLPLDVVFDKLEKQTDLFFVDPKAGTIHQIERG